MFYMHDIGLGWWLLMSIGMVAFWALLIYGLVWLLRGQPQQRGVESSREDPQDVLKRRLAAGEISIAEYERLREAISEDRQEPLAA